jgi:lysophospholipase L1-like esterase
MMPTSREAAARGLLLSGSVLLTLLCLELGCRLWQGPSMLWHWPNLVVDAQRHFAHEMDESHVVRDPLLGWVPRPGFKSRGLNYNAQGTRVMPPSVGGAGAPIVATGDSFALGEDVTDDNSWPAFLQTLLQRRIVNAGVSGYGLDQIVLRTEQQAASLRPSLIVMSFVADDLWRSEMRRLWGGEKPYFAVSSDGVLALHNVAAPGVDMPDDRLSFWQRRFGWSMLLKTILSRLDEHDEWISDNRRATVDGTGERLACPLMRRLAALGAPALVVAQYEPLVWSGGGVASRDYRRRLSRLVLDCAALAGLATLDTFDALDGAVRDHGLGSAYLNYHHSAEGNRLVAVAIAAALAQRGMLR